MRYDLHVSFLGVIKIGEIYSPGSVTLGTITPLASRLFISQIH